MGGGSPTSFGGGGPRAGGRTGGGGGGDAGRLTFIAWKEATLKKPGAVTGGKAGEEQPDEADLLRKMLHISDWDPRPTLLYFHRDHEDEEDKDSGKPWAKQCKELNDELVARWAGLYVFVEVDMANSDAEMLTRFGAGSGPSFAVVSRELEVSATSGPLTSGKKFAAFLERTVETQFSEYWSDVAKQLDEQKEALSEAKRLEKAKELDAALDRVRQVTRSTLRIAPFFDDAVKIEKKLAERLLDD